MGSEIKRVPPLMFAADDTAPWIWEYSTLDGDPITTFEYDDLDALKKDIAGGFTDYTWEEVARRGIFGTSVLVKQYDRYVDTGHWVYRRPMRQRADRLESEVQELTAQLAEAKARLQAVSLLKVWKDNLGRGFVFADELGHAIDPERFPEPKPIRLGAEEAAA